MSMTLMSWTMSATRSEVELLSIVFLPPGPQRPDGTISPGDESAAKSWGKSSRDYQSHHALSLQGIAHKLLAGIRDWFTERTATMDVSNARTSLSELG
jgi:hypothetical protein